MASDGGGGPVNLVLLGLMLKRVVATFVFPSKEAMASWDRLRRRRVVGSLVVFPLGSLFLFFIGMALVEAVQPVGFFASLRVHRAQSLLATIASFLMFFVMGPVLALLAEIAYTFAVRHSHWRQ